MGYGAAPPGNLWNPHLRLEMWGNRLGAEMFGSVVTAEHP